MKNNKGFTLIEMLIVMSIILMLVLLIIPNALQKQKALEKQGCIAQAKMIESQVMLYELEFNKSATSLDELVTAGYLQEDHMTCKSGEVFRIVNGVVVFE